MVEEVPFEDGRGTNKTTIDIYVEEQTLEYGSNKASIDNAVEDFVKEVTCEYDEDANKKISGMDVEALPFREVKKRQTERRLQRN